MMNTKCKYWVEEVVTKKEVAEGKVSEDQAIVYAQTVELRCLTQEVFHV